MVFFNAVIDVNTTLCPMSDFGWCPEGSAASIDARTNGRSPRTVPTLGLAHATCCRRHTSEKGHQPALDGQETEACRKQ